VLEHGACKGPESPQREVPNRLRQLGARKVPRTLELQKAVMERLENSSSLLSRPSYASKFGVFSDAR
jgi:hypothetical protein